ncbi:MAG: two-component system sensor histidine kinase BaeS [Gammaproteobacteria bacterium]|jgi:two-component system sensor histidine kinase BaeS
MLSTIRHKLFFAILAANLLLMVVIYFSTTWIFNASFRDYLDQTEASRLQPLVVELAEIYSQRQDWDWVDSQNRLWRDLIREHGHGRRLAVPPPRPPPPGEARPPPRGGPGPGILFKDQANRLIIGRPREADKAIWIPIMVDSDSAVGYLGFVRQVTITDQLDQLFAGRIRSNLLWLVGIVLLVTAIISIPLARRLVSPIETIRKAFGQLASGQYDTRMEPVGSDEFADLQRDFNRLTDTMQDNQIARQRWIADISHELRTPVAILQAEIEGMIDGLRERSEASIHSLHQEVIRLSKLINDLHELSLSDLGAMSYQSEPVDLIELLDEVIENHRPLFESAGIEIDYQAGLELMTIDADPDRLVQLFLNLASNSRVYTDAPGQLKIRMTANQTHAIVVWQDSKPGISMSDLPHLFERLYRVERSRNRNSGGSGLGLAICSNIADASGAEIVAGQSELGGLAVSITFPLVLK